MFPDVEKFEKMNQNYRLSILILGFSIYNNICIDVIEGSTRWTPFRKQIENMFFTKQGRLLLFSNED